MSGNKIFKVSGVHTEQESPFDRQKLISWLDQELIETAKVLVVGAGAIGNETLKNLALLGFKNIYIVDFDEISISNLSRTVLFKSEDLGKKKSYLAAKRTKELCLVKDANIYWFHGDIVWELGTGVYQEMDIILGCLDNVETRFSVNSNCRLAKTPWIDAGIAELRSRISIFSGEDGPCYACNASENQLKAKRIRYSCDNFKKKVISEGKVPTVQVASAFVSALQTQEALKIICNQGSGFGKKIYFEGLNNDFDVFELLENKDCFAHNSFQNVIDLDITRLNSVQDFLEIVSRTEYSGQGASLDLSSDRIFISSALCKICLTESIVFNKPIFKIFDTDLVCKNCADSKSNDTISEDIESSYKSIPMFNLENTEKEILNLSLEEIGIPIAHIVSVKDTNENYKYYKLNCLNTFFKKI